MPVADLSMNCNLSIQTMAISIFNDVIQKHTWSVSVVVSFWLQGLVVELIVLDIPLSGSFVEFRPRPNLSSLLTGIGGTSASVGTSPLSILGDVLLGFPVKVVCDKLCITSSEKLAPV